MTCLPGSPGSAVVATGFAQDDGIRRALELRNAQLPPGVRIEKTGSSAEMARTFKSLLIALALGILVSYMILASQYNSYVHPIVILLALPFSVTGAWIALWLAGATINVYSMIGLILLMGLVKKNSILLVDFTNQLRFDEKMPLVEALAKAGELRLRPILMTSFATMAAAVPPALKLGHGTAATNPMALCILGGTFLSTALTLFVVPLAYKHFVKLEEKWDPR